MYLHKEKGLNPRLTICARCGEDTKDIVLLGNDNTLFQCNTCNSPFLRASKKCPNCKKTNTKKIRELKDNEKIPYALCEKCTIEQKSFEKEIELGGVYFKCACGTEGIIKHDTDIAKKTREVSKVKPPNPIGISLDTCPACSK